MKKIKINKIQTTNLNFLVNKMKNMDPSIYITINKTEVYSRMYNPNKDIVKCFSLPIEELFEIDPKTPIDGDIRIPLVSGKRLIESLKVLESQNVKGELSIIFDGEDNLYYVEKIIIQDNRMKMSIICQDPELGFVSMTEAQMGNAFDKKSALCQFTLSKEILSTIESVMSFDTSETLKISSSKDGVHISSESFDIIVDDSVTEEFPRKHIFKSFLDKIDSETHTINLCEHRIIFESNDTNTQSALNLAIVD